MRALALALLIVGCTVAPASTTPSPVPTREPNTVNVTALLDLSGDRAPSGRPQRDAMQLWLDRPPLTATQKVHVKFVDVAGSAAKMLLELRRAAVEDRADAIVVGVSVAGDDAFAQAADVARVPILLTLPAAEPVGGGHGAFVFALAPAPDAIARVIVDDIVDRGVVTPMLLASDESPAAVLERTSFTAELARRGITSPGAVALSGTDGPARIRMAVAVAKSAVFAGPAASFADLIRPPTSSKASVARLYLSPLTEMADLVALRDSATLVTWPGSRGVTRGGRGSDLGPSFAVAFAERHGQPSTLAGSAYDALTLIDAAAAQAAFDPSRLRQRLEANTVAGAVSRYSFTPSRHSGFSSDDLTLLIWNPQTSTAVVPAKPLGDR